ARPDLNAPGLGVLNAPLARASGARLAEHLAGASAAGTGRDVHELAEDRLLHATHLAAALALRARRLTAAATTRTRVARPQVLDAHTLLDAGRYLIERQGQPQAKIGASQVVLAAARSREQVLEAALAELPHERAQRVRKVEAAEVEPRWTGA